MLLRPETAECKWVCAVGAVCQCAACACQSLAVSSRVCTCLLFLRLASCPDDKVGRRLKGLARARSLADAGDILMAVDAVVLHPRQRPSLQYVAGLLLGPPTSHVTLTGVRTLYIGQALHIPWSTLGGTRRARLWLPTCGRVRPVTCRDST